MPKAIQKNYLANSAARSELLIVLDYMISNCTDEKTALMQSDVIKYGHDQYNVDIRRDRIPVICQHLLEIQEKYPNKLPFVIEEKKMKANVKYYISKCIVSDDDAALIVRAINEDPRISESDTERITNEFLDKGFGSKRKGIIKDRAKANPLGNQYVGKKKGMAERYKYYENWQYSSALLTFSLSSVYKAKTMDPSFKDYLKKNEGKDMQGIIYQIKSKSGKKFDAVVYVPSHKTIFVHNINCIHVHNEVYGKKPSFDVKDKIYKSIEDWLRDYYSGLVGDQTTFEFKFVGTMSHRDIVARSYESFFGKKFHGVLRDRNTVIETASGPKSIKVQDCYGSITCNFESFRKWYMNYDIMKCVVILSPKGVNNLLLEDFAHRLNRRIQLYGNAPENSEINNFGACISSANTTPRE